MFYGFESPMHWGRSAKVLVGLVVAILLMSTGCAGAAAAAQATTTPTVTFESAATFSRPPTTGHIVEPISAVPLVLAANGYEEQEFFASGTATAFSAKSTPSDGKWSITPTTRAHYATRILVRRPSDPAKFNGTVLVEWMNVSDGESAPDWDYLNPMLMRDGYAYVAVSAQALGVDGGKAILGQAAAGTQGLVQVEPARYGTLHHPGDQYSLDMFAQIGKALQAPHPTALGGLRPKRIVAVGESQSAYYLTTFADALQPRTNIFDGIFIHSRGGSGAPLSGSTTSKEGPDNLRIRTDLKVPVFMLETQTDLVELGYAPAQQPNTDRIRTWEVAGTSHADTYDLDGVSPTIIGCTQQINDGPQHEVVQAAFSAFEKWLVDGKAPPSPPSFKLDSTNPPVLALDENGNVIGGVRTPAVNVPVSTLSGAAPAGTTSLCQLFGETTPFSPAKLSSLYQSQTGYLNVYTTSLDKAIAEGYILSADRASLLAQAMQVQFPA
jgi:Alpha/beta hydrolase domain